MSVDDWARQEAASVYLCKENREAHASGIVHAFDALLSDEAVEAAEDEQYRHGRDLVFGGGCACGEPFPLTRQGIRAHDLHVARAAIQAAIDSVTKEARNG